MTDTRPIEIATPLGDELLFSRMTVTEELGRLFRFDVVLESLNEEIPFEDVLGQDVTISVELPESRTRYFHGYVASLTYLGRAEEYCEYKAVVRPWFWLLTRTADCRIFQDQRVPDIIQEVLGDFGFSDIENRLARDYREWEYCVQYRETAFNFISRLMEQEGIYYFWRHEDGKHTLVMADDLSAHEPREGYEEVPFHLGAERAGAGEGEIYYRRHSENVQPTAYAMTDFDFTAPGKDLLASLTVSRTHAHGAYEIFDFPGEYEESAEGDNYVQARLDELSTGFRTASFKGTARGLAVGDLFMLTDSQTGEQIDEYLITAATIELANPSRTAGEESEDVTFDMSFTAILSEQRFVSARITPKPAIHGLQTAVVTGKSGEEIWCDEYDRVRIQFPWDRRGENDENSTCWVRSVQSWAGGEWGAIHIPRIGQEVLVEFLEGDPDRPVIVGRVYNAQNTHPYALPDDKTQSGIKSRSSKGGSPDNFNEFRFEDKKGSEQIYLHAEKDMNTVVENNQSLHVMHDRKKEIDENETVKIGANRKETVGSNEKISVSGNRTEEVGGDEMITVGANRKEDITGDETRTVGANFIETIGGNVQETITGSQSIDASAGIIILTPATITITPTGGTPVTAPGGITAIEGGMNSVGAKQSKDYSLELELVATSISINTTMAHAKFGAKMEFLASQVSLKGMFREDYGIEAKTVGAALKQIGAKIGKKKPKVEN